MTPEQEHLRIGFVVNGEPRQIEAPARMTLADALRSELELTGTHLGCEQGVCGACTVLLDGVPVRGCLMFAFQADGRDVTTVEGLSTDGELHELQELFLRERALQCGFCTPGLLVALSSIDRRMTSSELRTYLAGHICRCTGYEPIVRAAELYLRQRRLLDEDATS